MNIVITTKDKTQEHYDIVEDYSKKIYDPLINNKSVNDANEPLNVRDVIISRVNEHNIGFDYLRVIDFEKPYTIDLIDKYDLYGTKKAGIYYKDLEICRIMYEQQPEPKEKDAFSLFEDTIKDIYISKAFQIYHNKCEITYHNKPQEYEIEDNDDSFEESAEDKYIDPLFEIDSYRNIFSGENTQPLFEIDSYSNIFSGC